jgi:hypothetical protein
MPGYLLHVNATMSCPHQGKVNSAASYQGVKVGNQAVVTMSDQFPIAGCTFTIPGPKPQPCMKVTWLMAATKVKVKGKAVVLVDSQGLCQTADQIPQGPPSVTQEQQRVKGQ